MKVIDLLNKIANGEKVPYIRYFNRLDREKLVMLTCEENLIYRLNEGSLNLNDEVEFIEEETNLDIINLKKEIENEQNKHRTYFGRVNSLFNLDEEANFITFSGHFHIKFKNGYEISLTNAGGSYTDNLSVTTENDEKVYSQYIELAIIKDDYFCTRDFVETEDDDVLALVTSKEVVNIMFNVSNRK